MASQRRDPPIEYDNLAAALKALGYGARLELLDMLRFPKSLGDIRLTPRRGSDQGSADRPAARSTVLGHLDKLVDARLVEVGETERAGRTVPEYVVNPTQLYALIEELRRLSTMYAGSGPVGDQTGTLGPARSVEEVKGPHLVLVHGVYEGKRFRLAPETRSEAKDWTIGRRRDVAIALDYDPYVSLENTRIERDGSGFTIVDLESKNGTSVNWERLPPGGSRPLRAADVIGVGRSSLSFVPGP